VPAYAPPGIKRRREFSSLKPRELMMMGLKVEVGPLVIIMRKAAPKVSQN
jgi:hypothetical protein